MTGPTFATHAPAAPPRAPRPALKPGEKPDDGAGARVLIYLRLHWLMILFCGTLLGGAGAAVAWELLASKYESYGQFQVSSVQMQIANQNPQTPRTDFSTYMKTTATIIKSEFVLNAALRDLKDLPTIKAQKSPLKFLDEELQVTPQDGGEVIRIAFKGHEPDDTRKIVNAVQKAFMDQMSERKVRDDRARLTTIEDARTTMRNAVANRGLSQAQKAPAGGVVPAGAGAPAPLPVPGAAPAPGALSPEVMFYKDNRGLLANEIAKCNSLVTGLPVTINLHKRRQEVLRERLELIQKQPVPQHVEDYIENDKEVAAAKAHMVQARAAWKRLESTGDENAPAVLERKYAYEADRKRWEELKAQKLKTLESARKLAAAQPVAAELETLINTIQQYEEQLDTSKKWLAGAQKLYTELPPVAESGVAQAKFEKEYNPEDSNLMTADGVFRTAVQQYYLAKLELESPPRVSILQPATAPVQKDTKKQVLGTAFAGVMGFVLMALGVVGYETMSRRVSSLADVKVSMSAPVVGVIPCQPGDASAAGAGGRDPVRRAAANEAIDKLRAYVSQTWLDRGAASIAVTSAIGEEGKAFVAFGLASSLAQAGYRTLLVDFDLREPAVHPYAGVSNAAGVCELLRAETDARSVVQFLPSGLHLLPAGKWSDEARKAATGEKLGAVLAKMKEAYDCVVIHAHALLTVAESVEVARRCEAVLVCAKYRETVTPLLKRAAERVAAMEIPYSGVVYVGATEREALC